MVMRQILLKLEIFWILENDFGGGLHRQDSTTIQITQIGNQLNLGSVVSLLHALMGPSGVRSDFYVDIFLTILLA